MDLLLFNAYFLADDPHEQEIMRPFPPLGPQYVAAYLRANGFPDVAFWDSTFRSGIDAFEAELRRARPRCVGLYGHTVTRPVAGRMVEAARRQGARVIAGGPDPSSDPDAYLGLGVDVCVMGEGEETARELMEHLRSRGGDFDREALRTLPGIAFVHRGERVRTPARARFPDLDALPHPLRERDDIEPYFEAWRRRHGRTAMSLSTTRGCPYPCTWCSKGVFQDSFRRRAVDRVVDEILEVRERFAPDDLWFVDDTFTIRRSWVLEFCERVVERGAVTPFYVIGRVDAVDREVLAAMKRAGCYRIYYSAESGSQRVLDAMRKGFRVEDIRRAGALTREAGIEMGAFVMLGYPGEEKEDVLDTVRLVADLQPEVVLLSIAHPIRGTAFHELVKDRILPGRPGAEEEGGGRLRWRSKYPYSFYEFAGRLLWTEKEWAVLRRERRYGGRFLRHAIKLPLYRAAFRMYPGSPGVEHPNGWDRPKRFDRIHRGRAGQD